MGFRRTQNCDNYINAVPHTVELVCSSPYIVDGLERSRAWNR
jgi:hypothetical protein